MWWLNMTLFLSLTGGLLACLLLSVLLEEEMEEGIQALHS